MAQYTGKVKWFNNVKGYGFLGNDAGADVFVHYTAIQGKGYKSLKEDDLVEYDVVDGGSGKPQATNVVIRQLSEAESNGTAEAGRAPG